MTQNAISCNNIHTEYCDGCDIIGYQRGKGLEEGHDYNGIRTNWYPEKSEDCHNF